MVPGGGGRLACGCELVHSHSRAFSTTPGVDPRLVSSNWFKNHYKWIVWKLASLEVVFPRQCARRCVCVSPQYESWSSAHFLTM